MGTAATGRRKTAWRRVDALRSTLNPRLTRVKPGAAAAGLPNQGAALFRVLTQEEQESLRFYEVAVVEAVHGTRLTSLRERSFHYFGVTDSMVHVVEWGLAAPKVITIPLRHITDLVYISLPTPSCCSYRRTVTPSTQLSLAKCLLLLRLAASPYLRRRSLLSPPQSESSR